MNTAFLTRRLRARPWTPEDAPAALAMYRDPEVTRFLPGAGHSSLEEQRATLARAAARYRELGRGYGFLALEALDDGRIVGAALLKPLPGHEEVEVGWHLARPEWGQGFATEAGAGAIEYAFAHLPIPRIVAVVHPDNHRSQAVAERLGMQLSGRVNAYNLDLLFYVLPRPTVGA